MKRVICTLTLALIIALALPLCSLADDVPADRPSSGAAAASSDNSTSGLLDSIVNAVSDLLGHGNDDPEEPLNDVHPPDWNEPTAGPDKDDYGWDDTHK